uniref:Tripartite motif containing 25 n=1 Tax=Echeneis naucrates TaxID=173247 RepID=A0A665UQ90_ECHNA
MAEVLQSDFSLLGLEEELTCSICLSTFQCPVTIPCGHNFCQDCLLATWRDTYSCPQCRTHFPTKPELKKNTVLSTVVETFNLRSSKSEMSRMKEEKKVIRCDTCMEAEAAQTCLTCMASFCEEHLRPHRENPNFAVHQLSDLVSDLSERICPDHHKLMELFCSEHGRPICSLCLQQVHKGCSFTSPEEQRSLKESDLREKLGLLDGKIKKNDIVLSQMMDTQNKLKDSAANRKKIVAADYQQMRDMLTREERDALHAVDREMESGQTKLRALMKKFNENIDNMNKAKEDIHNLLSQSQTLAFLQASFNLPQAVNFDPYTPRINLDSKKVTASLASAAALKEHMSEIFKQPVEAREQMIKRGIFFFFNKALIFSKLAQSMENLSFLASKSSDTPPASTLFEWDFCCLYLPDSTVLTLDPRTAHKRITLTEEFTKASVSDGHTNYPDCPERFAVCSQVLTSKGFSRGRHYWEVKLSSNNFIGIGLAYGSIDRKGPTSRLGRNNQSWCVEWFNVKLSAWHNSSETVLANYSPKRVGVLLDCEGGMATFYSVADRAYPFHSFVFPFAEAVYPAFWLFSSGSSISLCKLVA